MTTDQQTYRFIASKLAEAFGLPLELTEQRVQDFKTEVDRFLQPNGSNLLTWFYQTPTSATAASTAHELYVSSLENEPPLKGKNQQSAFAFTRPRGHSQQTATPETITTLELCPDVLEGVTSLLTEIYLPQLESKASTSSVVAELGAETHNVKSALLSLVSTTTTSTAAVETNNTATSSDASCLVSIGYSMDQKSFAKAASDAELAARAKTALLEWIKTVGDALVLHGPSASNDTTTTTNISRPPAEELHVCRKSLVKLAGLAQQLSTAETKATLGVASIAAPTTYKQWKELENHLAESIVDLQETIVFLEALSNSFDPVNTLQSLEEIRLSLPGMFNELLLAAGATQQGNKPLKLCMLLEGIGTLLIQRSRTSILAGGAKLWDQDKKTLIACFNQVVALHTVYEGLCYDFLRSLDVEYSSSANDGNSSSSLPERFLEGYTALASRCTRLSQLFTMAARFTDQLAKQAVHIPGVSQICTRFTELVTELRQQYPDFLDVGSNTNSTATPTTGRGFDQDFLEFCVHVNDLELEFQDSLRNYFSNAVSTKHALSLAAHFQELLPKDVVEAEMHEMYAAAFLRFGQDIEEVQRLYEKHKDQPVVPRGAPPVAGAILWSRCLNQRIEPVMQQFSLHPYCMESVNAKKVVKLYNRVSQTLMEFEALYQAAWLKGIDSALIPLTRPVLALHPQSPSTQLLVNLDQSIIQLIRESQWLGRMGIQLPESAQLLLLRGPALQQYYDTLAQCLIDIDTISKTIVPPPAIGLMKSHFDDIVSKTQAGLLTVTWTSVGIEGFIQQLVKSVDSAMQVAVRIRDAMTTQIQSSIAEICDMCLLDLSAVAPAAPSHIDEFVQKQKQYLERQEALLTARCQEVELLCQGIINMASGNTLNNNASTSTITHDFKQYSSELMRQAVLSCTSTTLETLSSRLMMTSQQQNNNSNKILSLELVLDTSNRQVELKPSLQATQEGISLLAGSLIDAVSRVLGTFTTKVPLLPAQLQQSIDRLSSLVLDTNITAINRHKASLEERFAFLWTTDSINQACQEFIMVHTPSLEDCEIEMTRLKTVYKDIETVCSAIKLSSTSGLHVQVDGLCQTLQSTATAWSLQFSTTMHQKAHAEFEALRLEVVDNKSQLQQRLVDLDSIASVLAALEKHRHLEMVFDSRVQPIHDMYRLLARFDISSRDTFQAELQDLESLKQLIFKEELAVAALTARQQLAQVQSKFETQVVADGKTLAADSVYFNNDWIINGPLAPGLAPLQAAQKLKEFQVVFKQRKLQWQACSKGEALFGLPTTPVPDLVRIEQEIEALDQLYALYITVLDTLTARSAVSWTATIPLLPSIAEEVADFTTKCKKLPKSLRELSAYKDCRQSVENLNALMPLLAGLAQRGVQERHWIELANITGCIIPLPSQGLTLQNLLDAKMAVHRDAIEDLCAAVVKEEAVEKKLHALAAQWKIERLTFAEHKQRGFVVLKPAETSELMEKLEDSQMTLGSLAANRYASPFRKALQDWTAKLGAVSETMELWLAVQAMWTYMEAVFSGGDIVRQLPLEAQRFQAIDATFMKAVAFARETSNLLETCVSSNEDTVLRGSLPHLLEQLEVCQKSLAAYLETKRSEFPRFYFVSDPTLLEILSLGSDPPSVVPHFQSGLFDSLSNVTFDKNDKTKITEMWSREGECVPLETAVDAKGNIEVWLQSLVSGMQDTMKNVIRDAAADVYDQELEEFVLSHPAQVALLGLQFQWTAETQAALHAASRGEKGALTKALKKADSVLRRLVAMALRDDLTKVQRTALETCITVYMHQKEATEELVKKKIKDPQDFEWLKQCRFYWREDRDTVIISICDVDFEYSYEYLGVKERLVITPLTDVCYITLSQALGMYLGGAPAGPAGTGKTETTKDLGATLGKYVVVFNCSDQMDHKGMGKIYKGLAQSGLWGCFDEFNRINLDVLSVCAQQVHCVLTAIRERKKTFMFTDGTMVPLDPRVGYFITMNPGYAGRQELPENLKALFRGVTMMVPNRQIIMKVKLAAAGYQENDILSKKFFVLYALCEQQLSKQPHYDFGLRNILSVLRTAGASKRTNPTRSETELMMRTLRDMNMSKFVAEDVPLFLALIEDIFPGQKASKAPEASVIAELHTVCEERGLVPHPSWIDKCMQLYESTLVRHGNMVVGPPGSGKSTAVDCLAAALSNLGQKTVVWRMNPKAITAPQMFGKMDAATGDWTDGVFAVLWRRAARAGKSQNTWIVLDGPVDAVWIENLNTVLDDNKVLTLANGDRVLMTPQMRLIFECENLNNASPATVSRAGIIFISDSELGWQPVVQSWLATRSEKEALLLKPCFDTYVAAVLEFVRLNCRPAMQTEAVCLVNTLLTLLTGIMGPGSGTGSSILSTAITDTASTHSLLANSMTMNASMTAATSEAAASYAAQLALVEKIFLFCLAWSLGGLLPVDDRVKLDSYLRKMAPNTMPLSAAAAAEYEGDTIYEFVVNEETGQWQHWKERIPRWNYPTTTGTTKKAPRFTQMLVPTLDSVRYEYLLTLVHTAGKATLLVGGPGTAKTTIIQQFLSTFDRDQYTNKTITFSYLTTPQIFQNAVEACMEKRQGRTFGPPAGKQMTLFIDDLSMPKLNDWGDQVTNELLRQLLEQGGFYSLEKPIGDIKQFVDTRYVAAMNIPGGGRSDVPNRLKRQCCIFYVPPPSASSIQSLFGCLLSGHFNTTTGATNSSTTAQALVPATMDLWNALQTKLLPTPTKFHYTFTLRDLSKVFQGVMMANTSSLQTDQSLLSLWKHECLRVFCDKLVSPDDKAWVHTAVNDVLIKRFGAEAAANLNENPSWFVDFLRDAPVDPVTGEAKGPRPVCYEAAYSLDTIRNRVQDLYVQTQEQNRGQKVDLVLFKDALEHLLRISRILSMERSSILLVGVGGSGKQSLARLAARISGAYCFQITLTKSYGVTNLLEDLKNLYKYAALKSQPVCFLFTDADVKDDAFLEYINQLLMTGEITGLFPRDELDSLLNDVRPVMKLEAPGTADTWDNLYSFCMNRVRDRLHVVLSFSPVGPKFARWAQQFPGLINGCTIDWFLPWPEEALLSVSSKMLRDSRDLSALPATLTTSLQSLMATVHSTVTRACHEYFLEYKRHAHVTPKSYIASLESFKQLYSRKLAQLRDTIASITNGLAKMNQAKEAVGLMKVELVKKTADLDVASAQAEALLKEIRESTAVAEKERAKVGVIVEAVRKKADEIAGVKAEAEHDLAAAQPALDAAVSALNSIAPKDIQALKALKNPPDIVKRIFDCVLLLRHFPVNKVTWHDFKGAKVIMGSYEESFKMMSDMQFLQKLVNFPKEAINDETVELLQPYFAGPDFNYDSAKNASGSVAGLCNWAEAMCSYHTVAKVVEPKIVKLRESEEELRVATKERQAAEEELAAVQAALDEMQKKFDTAMANKKALEDDAADTQRKMSNAIALLTALGGEEARWVAQQTALEESLTNLVGDCSIASSFLNYLGPFNRAYRDKLSKDIAHHCSSLGVPVSPAVVQQVTGFLAEDTEVGQWAVEGLPTDNLSTQNGILVTRAARCPLLVDPQGQGRAWLLRHAPGIKVTSLTDKHFRAQLEESLTAGRSLLIENVGEDLDPLLDPVLEKNFIRKGKITSVQLGDKEVTVGDGFQLFVTTRLPNPKFTPELSAKVTVVDFTVTPAGLEDQLLARLVLKEKRELEEQRRRLVEDVQSYRQKVEQLEADLLHRLSSSTGNLLYDTQLIDVLAMTKQTAQEVAQKLKTASETRQRITVACEEYRPAAERATLLYFLVSDFAAVNYMYQTSLAQFIDLYESSIDTAQRSDSVIQRASNIADHLTANTYTYVQRGLFERHKLVFALILTNRILLARKQLKPEEMQAFLKMGAALGPNTVLKRKPKEWIPSTVWQNIHALAELIPAVFGELPDIITASDGPWKAWYDQEAPESVSLPVASLETKLTKFQRMCLVRAFREDRTLVSAVDYITAAMGTRHFVESMPAQMESVWHDSKPNCPIICLLSPGADPTKLIEELAKRRKIKCLGVSMGQGQEIVARKYMTLAAAEGHWVLLQNAHLGLGYLAEVEQYLAKAQLSQLHESFRVWVTAEPDPAFPIGLLQMSIKATNEPPVGVRAGLKASYQWVTQDMLDAVNKFEWRQLLFAICFMHSIVQERRKFGPIGWNVPYEFNTGDLSACVQFLQNHVQEMQAKKVTQPDWSTIRYMVSTIQYGGRITDDYDRKLMDTYAQKFFHQGMLQRLYEVFADPRTKAKYLIPDAPGIDSFRAAIEELPPQDNPELFGLHSNADITFRTLQVQDALQIILDTQGSRGGATVGGVGRDEGVDKTCKDLLAKLPAVFDAESIKEGLKKLAGGTSAPLNIHLRQEIDRLNKVVKVVAETLKTLRLAIAGSIAMNDTVLSSMEALYLGRVPKNWLKVSWECNSLGTWFQGLLLRHEQLERWLTIGRPKSFWLPGFFNPQGFLTAVKQEVARKHAADKWALDDVVLVSEVTRYTDPTTLRDSPSEGVFIHGLFLEGCSWSVKQGAMVDSDPKKLHCAMPVMHVTAVLGKDKKKSGYFEAPCYKIKKRTGLNFISTFMLATEAEASKWTLRGVALLCSVDT